MRKWRKPVGLLSLLSCLLVTTLISAASKNPYSILGVTRSASQKEIQKAYRQQCLRLHPDKNTHRSLKEREWCESQFKQVQQAYSMIGDEEDRRSFDLHELYSGAFTGGPNNDQPSNGSGDHSSFFGGRRTTGDPTLDALFRAFGQSSGPSVFFAQGPDGRPRFGVRRAFPTGPTNFAPTASGLSFKSIYKQQVQVPLEKLFTGAEIEFHLVDNIWTRWRAAIRGKIVYLSLYQGLLYSMPMIRTSKVLAAIVGLFIAHVTLPKPDPMQSYLSKFPKGAKVAIVRFQQKRNDQPEVIFEIQEAPHKRYQREGDDLRTSVRITHADAATGCTKEIPSLDPDQSPIKISIPPHSTHGKEICIRGKGWPTGNGEIHGDLFVRIEIRGNRTRKRGRQKTKSP